VSIRKVSDVFVNTFPSNEGDSIPLLKQPSHVIVSGNISFSSLQDFMEEFFHPDHGEQVVKRTL
jgi:hypothetical protein